MTSVYANNNRRANTSVCAKPFCKVCFDTGKPEQVYTSHYVRESRDINSRVVCPTLLSMNCRFCGCRGHTVSKCRKIINAPLKKNSDLNVVDKVKRAIDVMTVKSNLTNIFDNLSSDDDDDFDADSLSLSVGDLETVSSCSIDDTVFPMLKSSRSALGSRSAWGDSGRMSYAEMLSTPYVEPQSSIVETPSVTYISSDSECEPVVSVAPVRKSWFTKNWADYSDSDSDDE
jgi:hypothetical protein